KVEGRAAGIAAVHRRVDLQKVVVRTGVKVAPAPRDDAAADGVVETERAADCENPVPDPRRITVAPADMRQRGRPVDLEQGEIGERIAPDDPSRVFSRVLSHDRYALGVLYDMIVSDDIAARVDDKSRPQGHAGDLRGGCRPTTPRVEEAAQQIVEQRGRYASGGDAIFRGCRLGPDSGAA